MEKRTIARIGNIFCVEIDNIYKCYFQFVAYDRTQLMGQVIRVFKTRYPMDYVPNLKEIVRDEVSFYSHALVGIGLQDHEWYNVGNNPDKGDVENIYFKTESYERKWRIWKINKEFEFVDTLPDVAGGFHYGVIFPAKDVLAKIKTGHYIGMTND